MYITISENWCIQVTNLHIQNPITVKMHMNIILQ